MRRRGRREGATTTLPQAEVTELREALDRLTTLHLKQAVQLVHLEDQVASLHASLAEVSDRPDLDHTLAQLVTNLADVRRRLPA